MRPLSVRAQGFSLVEIMCVVGIIGLLSSLVVASFAQARSQTQQNICIENLRLVTDAKDRWALDNSASTGAAPTGSEINAYMRNVPVCPASGVYSYGNIGPDPTCSIAGHELG
jgi:prepilin-type N-terminal cleavage/methylation domain-containing protein